MKTAKYGASESCAPFFQADPRANRLRKRRQSKSRPTLRRSHRWEFHCPRTRAELRRERLRAPRRRKAPGQHADGSRKMNQSQASTSDHLPFEICHLSSIARVSVKPSHHTGRTTDSKKFFK